MADAKGARVDVVVVSYNSRDHLRSCVEGLTSQADIHAIVVDNASRDGTIATVSDLDLTALRQSENRGFAHGCNVGWRRGSAPLVLFLNPDASITSEGVRRLAAILEGEPAVGAVAPLIGEADGSISHSQRRFPRPAITFSQALYLHRLLPYSRFTNDIICDAASYARAGEPDWVSGAAIMLRRSDLESLGGFDERFFMYCEDVDLCRKLSDRGLRIRFEPEAVAVHQGGASAPRAALLPVLAQSRVLYARKHFRRFRRYLEQGGIALGALTHVVPAKGGMPARLGHLKALAAALRPARDVRPPQVVQNVATDRGSSVAPDVPSTSSS